MFSNKMALILAFAHLLVAAFVLGMGEVTSGLLFLLAAVLLAATALTEDENA